MQRVNETEFDAFIASLGEVYTRGSYADGESVVAYYRNNELVGEQISCRYGTEYYVPMN